MKHPQKGISRKVAVFGCKHTTKDLMLGLARQGLSVDHCVTISPQKAVQQQVAGYYDLKPFLEQMQIPYSIANKYSLKSKKDKELLLDQEFDVVLVMGWQRLIPDWLLESLSIGAFGMHGSNRPLPHGRGRSPMNWSLIQGKRIFFTHLFQYLPGVDDGPIVGQQKFDITEHDNCHTMHFKNLIAMIKLCIENLPALIDGSAILRPQPKEGVCFYPRRTAEDGLIFWSDSTIDIYNLIRAVTRPFPGAFSFHENDTEKKCFFWRAIPFDSHLDWPDARFGEIVEVFYDGSFIVKTGDGSILVLESEGISLSEKDIGTCFSHMNVERKKWEDLPV